MCKLSDYKDLQFNKSRTLTIGALLLVVVGLRADEVALVELEAAAPVLLADVADSKAETTLNYKRDIK